MIANHHIAPISMTRHAQCRQKQRSIPTAVIEALLEFGERRQAGHGSESVYFTKKSWKKLASYMGAAIKGVEGYRSCYLIEGSDGAIITAAYRH